MSDEAPGSERPYPPTVTLVRRSMADHETSADGTTLADVEAWLMGDAASEDDTLRLIERFARRLARSGAAVDRLSVHTGTLHPQAIRNTWIWHRGTSTCDEIRIAPGALDERRRDTPFSRARMNGEPFQGQTRATDFDPADPILGDLPRQGMTAYAIVPLGAQRHGRFNILVIATAQPSGFPPDMLLACEQPFALFALHVARHVTLRMLDNITRTYLGRDAGRRVLEGSIRRGSGEAGECVIWVSDLRGFTQLTETQPSDIVLAVLDAYFEAMVNAVMDQDGDVLKFVGDGLLASFPVSRVGSLAAASRAGLSAARAAVERLRMVGAQGSHSLGRPSVTPEIRTGIALHAGDVFFGNVGAPDRLDFTVIGRAVNIAARVEGLCSLLDRPILLTEPVAMQVGEHLDDLGWHALKGVATPQRIYAPPRDAWSGAHIGSAAP